MNSGYLFEEPCAKTESLPRRSSSQPCARSFRMWCIRCVIASGSISDLSRLFVDRNWMTLLSLSPTRLRNTRLQIHYFPGARRGIRPLYRRQQTCHVLLILRLLRRESIREVIVSVGEPKPTLPNVECVLRGALEIDIDVEL